MNNSIFITAEIKSMDEIPYMEDIEVLQRVTVTDRDYIYDMSFRHGSLVRVYGSNGEKTHVIDIADGKREALRVVWNDASENDSMLFINHRRSGFCLLSEGKCAHFSWDDGKLHQISPNPRHQSAEDQEIISLARDHRNADPCEKTVLINGVDSLPSYDRQTEIIQGQHILRKMEILAELKKTDATQMSLAHFSLTAKNGRSAYSNR